MTHVLVAGRIHEAGVELLRKAPGITLDLVDEISTESYAPLVDRADAVLIRTQPMPRDVIDRANVLKFVSRHGVGYDAVDVAALNRRNIPLSIVGDVNSRSVAEHTMMLMLALSKKAIIYDRATKSSDWSRRNRFDAFELDGKTLLLVGFGRIGRIVAGLARAFGMTVCAYDPYVADAAMLELGATPLHDLEEALAVADVVSVHIPLSSGEPLIGARQLACLKPSAIVMNTARGGIIDETALATALVENRLAGAGLDVFSSEPPPPNHPLFGLENVIVSPHSASLTQECAARMSMSAAQNILDFFARTIDPALIVNKSDVDPAQWKPT
jgi:D-3-phosphoglycerate dehydrogenase / 2-oxoglutarate reductase